MLEYHNNATSITIELAILSGGYSVTGRTPTVLIRNKETSNYFDFASRTFTGITTSATAVLTSAIEGLYRFTWDVSGLDTGGALLKTHYYMFEYHDATSLAIDDVVFRVAPLTTANVMVSVAGGGGITKIQGIWTAKQKEKLFDEIKDIKEKISDFKKQTILLLRRILGKKTLQKEDLDFITDIRRTDLAMWKEVLDIFKLNEDATEKELIEKIREWMAVEEEAKKELIELLDEKIGGKKEVKDPDLIDIDDEGDED